MNERSLASVWPAAQQPAREQRRGRYLPESAAHPGKMLPALARHAIEAFSAPGELVLDPMCGIGTTLVEAVHLGRRAVGVELEARWAVLAAQNVCLAREHGAHGRGLVIRGDARQLARGLLDELAGQVSLILTSPPYGRSTHGQVRKRAGRIEKFDERYSDNPANLAHLPQRRDSTRRPPFMQALAEIIAGCEQLLTAGGRIVLTARPYRRQGALVDLPGQLTALGQSLGLEPETRHAALLCALRGERLVPRASFFQLRHQRTGVVPRMLLIAHEDVLVLRKRGRPGYADDAVGCKRAHAERRKAP
jgi:modification methylase